MFWLILPGSDKTREPKSKHNKIKTKIFSWIQTGTIAGHLKTNWKETEKKLGYNQNLMQMTELPLLFFCACLSYVCVCEWEGES